MQPPIPARTCVEWWAGVSRLEMAVVSLRTFDVTRCRLHSLELQFPFVLLLLRQRRVMQFQGNTPYKRLRVESGRAIKTIRAAKTE